MYNKLRNSPGEIKEKDANNNFHKMTNVFNVFYPLCFNIHSFYLKE